MMRGVSALILSASSLVACGDSDSLEDETQPAGDTARVVSAREALVGADVPTLDPATMENAEIRIVLDGRPICAFRYVSDGKPVLALLEGSELRGVIKINGSLVPLTGKRRGDGLVLDAGEIRTTVTAIDSRPDLGRESRSSEAELLFEVGEQLHVGYHGYFSCAGTNAPAAAGL